MFDIRDHGGSFGGAAGALIKNVIRGTSTMGVNATAIYANLPPIDLTKSIVVLTGIRTDYSGSSRSITNVATSVKLSASNRVLLQRQNADYSIFVSWMVIEFKQVKSLFTTRTTLTSTLSKNVTTPDMSRGQVLLFWSHESNSDYPGIAQYTDVAPILSHDGATTLNIQRGANTDRSTFVECCVVSI